MTSVKSIRVTVSTPVLLAGMLMTTIAMLGSFSPALAQDQPIVVKVDPVSTSDIIPIRLSGYSGEAYSVLDFDLSVVGFRVNGSDPSFELAALDEGGFGGILYDLRGGKKQVLGKRYNSGSARDMAHALADDVVAAVRKVPGIGKTKILFRCESPAGSKRFEIYMADFDGQNPRPITRDRTVVRDPSWNPVTGMAYYVSYLKGNPDIIAHNLRSGQRSVIANFGGTNSGPAISPDGNRLAMILSRDGNQELYLSSASGGNFTRLSFTSQMEVAPCWSPAGDQICVTSGARPMLHLVNANGGQMRRLQMAGASHATEPSWSPDGRWIAFTQTNGSRFSVYVVPAGGGDCINLVSGEDPSWSPNSRTLVFTRRVGGDRRVLSLLDVPTKQVKDLPLSSLGNCTQPTWGN